MIRGLVATFLITLCLLIISKGEIIPHRNCTCFVTDITVDLTPKTLKPDEEFSVAIKGQNSTYSYIYKCFYKYVRAGKEFSGGTIYILIGPKNGSKFNQQNDIIKFSADLCNVTSCPVKKGEVTFSFIGVLPPDFQTVRYFILVNFI